MSQLLYPQRQPSLFRPPVSSERPSVSLPVELFLYWLHPTFHFPSIFGQDGYVYQSAQLQLPAHSADKQVL